MPTKKELGMKTKIINVLKWIGLGFLEPIIRLISGDDVKKNTIQILKKIIFPVVAIFLFIGAWSSFADKLQNKAIKNKYDSVEKKQGKEVADNLMKQMQDPKSAERPKTLPTPSDIAGAYRSLKSEHKRIEKDKRKQIAAKTKVNNRKIKKWLKQTKPTELVNADGEKVTVVPAELAKKFKSQRSSFFSFLSSTDFSPVGLIAEEYTGPPTFIDQVKTSLFNVFCGFLLALFIAVPLGIFMGLSETLRDAINPFIQVFKPVSPVVWYLLVYMIVTTLLPDGDDNTTFYITFIAVGLCAMWATLVNTAVGVASVDKDILNVSKVLKLGTFQHIFKVVLPASIPLIFTGLRITMSVAWMVLIAIELLSSSPGLGTFVWEEYQGDALDSNSKIIFAMLVIGFIGFLLDRIMLMIQNLASFEDETPT